MSWLRTVAARGPSLLIRATFTAQEQVHGSALSNRQNPIWEHPFAISLSIAWTGAIDNAECKSMLQIADRRLLNAHPKRTAISETPHYRMLRKFTRSCFSLSVSPILKRRSKKSTSSLRSTAEPFAQYA